VTFVVFSLVYSLTHDSDALVAQLTPQNMNSKNILLILGLGCLAFSPAAYAQSFGTSSTPPFSTSQFSASQFSIQGSAAGLPSASQGGAVSYASVTQLNGLLAQLEATSKATLADLTKLRIEKWKTDGSSKKQSLSDVDSIQRNLQNALPEMMEQLRNAPEDMPATFKLYRNLDALYDVLGGVVESAGAFGPKDDFQALSNDMNSFEGTRKQFAERMNNLAISKEQEIGQLRTELKTAQAAIAAAPPKKIVVDDAEPPKKPVAKKKPAPKKPAPTTPAQAPAAQPKPQ
jgi:hypothetical protein